MKFFTFNDYNDYKRSRELIKKILKEARRKINRIEMLEKIDKIFIYMIQSDTQMLEFLREYIDKKYIKIPIDSLEKYQIKDRKNEVDEQKNQVYKLKEEEIYFIIQYENKIDHNISYNILLICMKIVEDWKQKRRTK